MNDYILISTAANGKIRAFVAYTKNTINEISKIHQTTPVVTAALGRLMTAAALMSTDLKNESDIITLQIKGDGPIGGVVAVVDSKSNVKGYVHNTQVDLPLNDIGKLDVKNAVGQGILTVIKDLNLKSPYIGQTKLVSGEIAEDMTYYFTVSEQTPSAVALGVLVDTDLSVKHAGGFIVQLMPDCTETEISTLEKNLSKITSITKLFDDDKLPEDVLAILFDGFEYSVHEKRETKFFCHCNKDLVEDALITIGPKDIKEILETDGQAELNCHFCNKKYMFTKADLENILNKF